ncbi:ATP-grasp domain-containing protein [Nonomuraea helvata]|uniref:Acetyl-CoA carboxylase biotin carboxylase subunit family protein n=1 Tax=Nonomuraea helvata TaxID=37484 RepID=A0ABV5SAE3_9ACTN
MTGFLVVGWRRGDLAKVSALGVDFTVVAMAAELADPELADADTIVCDDIRDPTTLAGALIRAGVGRDRFSHVYTDRESAIIATAFLGEYFGDDRICLRTAFAMRDKSLQKGLIRDAGLPVARHALLASTVRDPAEAVGGLPYPMVVKPVTASSTAGVTVVRSAAELRAVVAGLRATAHGRQPLLAEEFVTGTELHADGIVADGRLTFMSVSRYLGNALGIRDGTALSSVVLREARHVALFRETRRLAAASLAALGLRRGVFHLEFFDTGHGLVFSECGARPGGAMIVEAVAETYGLDLSSAGFALAAGQAPRPPAAQAAQDFGWCNLPSPPGRLLRAPSERDLLGLPWVVGVRLDHQLGSVVPDNRLTIANKLGMALVTGPGEAEVQQRIADTVAYVRSRVEVAAT